MQRTRVYFLILVLALACFVRTQAFLSKVDKRPLLSKDAPIVSIVHPISIIRSIQCPQLKLSMSLVPLDTEELRTLIAVGPPTAAQYSSYWGRTAQEQYGRAVESAIVSILGMCFSYFMSFVLGSFVATIFGALFLFWGILSPELKAYQRNWELLGGREIVDMDNLSPGRDPDRAGMYGALFLGHIRDVCVVEGTSLDSYEYNLDEFSDYDANDDDLERYTGQPYLIRVQVADSKDRTLQVHARLLGDYLSVEVGMPVVGIMLATTPRFDRLAAITDLFVPEGNCYIGDYPYLNRPNIESLLGNDDELWDKLQDEGYPEELQTLIRAEREPPNKVSSGRRKSDEDSSATKPSGN